MIDVKHMLGLAGHAAQDAGEAIMEIRRTGILNVTLKTDASPVTAADKTAQEIISGHLATTGLPVLSEESIGVSYRQRRRWGYCWIVDPLDGTREFINGSDEFTVNIALVYKNLPVGGVIFAPAKELTYGGSKEGGVYKKEKGRIVQFPPLAERLRIRDLQQKEAPVVAVSRSHMSVETTDFIKRFRNPALMPMGSSLKFMTLIEQQADVYPRLGQTMEWDTAAAHAILNASNRGVYESDLRTQLVYNKPDLRHPFFIAF